MAQLPIDDVTVGRNGQKIVVETEKLDLVVTLKKRTFIPQADVSNRALILGNGLGFDGSFGRVALWLQSV